MKLYIIHIGGNVNVFICMYMCRYRNLCHNNVADASKKAKHDIANAWYVNMYAIDCGQTGCSRVIMGFYAFIIWILYFCK